MANTLNNTLNKVGDAIEAVMGGVKKSTPYNSSTNHAHIGQTCLERFGMEARNSHLLKNEWRKDLAYSKSLVDAEYMIQTEFKVSSYEDRLNEQEDARIRKEAERNKTKIEKLQAKKDKIDAKIANLEQTASDRKYKKETRKSLKK